MEMARPTTKLGTTFRQGQKLQSYRAAAKWGGDVAALLLVEAWCMALCSTVGCGETCSGVDVRWMCEVDVEVEVEAMMEEEVTR